MGKRTLRVARTTPRTESIAVQGARLLRTTRHGIGKPAMGGPPPRPDPMDNDQARHDIAMENWRQDDAQD